tara:strand:- start:5778 stop:6896 length:1119 start_codon:yes stop_codon:yes gene_type:complete
MNVKIRKKCIFCDYPLEELYLEKNLKIPLSCFTTEKEEEGIFLPYNIYTCKKCKTLQIKYLGDLKEIYKVNHADNTGVIMKNLHKEVSKIIIKYKREINNIVEIGSSKGTLSDLVLENNIVNKYYIIEPNYIGNNNTQKIIIDDFVENVDFKNIESNTLIISHVFEHFYNPLEILKLISDNKKLEYFFLIWPDLEYYKDNNIYHILNTEHTFYVDNNFIINLLNNHSFKLIEKQNYLGHSVIFIFKRDVSLKLCELVNTNYNFEKYFKNLEMMETKILKIITNLGKESKNKNICLWPASVHNQYFLMFAKKLKIDYFLDNSINKIDKYLYGYKIKILDFNKAKQSKENIIFLNGGVFNSEVFDTNCKNMYEL